METWNEIYSVAGVSVSVNQAVTRAKVEGLGCGLHGTGIYCTECLPVVQHVLSRVKSALESEVIVKETPVVPERQTTSVDAPEAPKFIALVNPIAKNAFAMRFDRAKRLDFSRIVFSGDGCRLKPEFTIGAFTNECKVCDADYLKSFKVEIPKVSLEYLEKLKKTTVVFMVDGERIHESELGAVFGVSVDFKKMESNSCLFEACRVSKPMAKEVSAHPEDWLGYMVPNGSRFEILIEKLPEGGGIFEVRSSFTLYGYTTKSQDLVAP